MASQAELRWQFLKAAYDLNETRSYPPIGMHEIVEFIDLDPQDPDFSQRVEQAARYCVGKGWIKKQTYDYSILSITTEGIDEVERNTELQQVGGNGEALQQAFLDATYDACMSSDTGMERIHLIAERLDYRDLGLDPSTSEYAERVQTAVTFLKNRGFIQYAHKGGQGSAAIKITAQGIDKVERQREENWKAMAGPDPRRTPDEFSATATLDEPPVEISKSLQKFKQDHPDEDKTAFIMMPFGSTRVHCEIAQAVRTGLENRGMQGVRADDKEYHEDLFYNILTYIHGCGLGVAVFERLEMETSNPNVALEVGYLFAMRKPVCLLKDRTIQVLQADLVGKLYRNFEPQEPQDTIPPLVEKWLSDKDLPSS